MDMLTQLIRLAQLQPSMQLRCQLQGKFALPHDTVEMAAPFHLALAGQCVIESDDGKQIVMQAGDMVIFPRGGAHWIRDVALRARDATRPRFESGGLLLLEKTGKGAPDVDLLCGRFDYVPGPAALLMQTLPGTMHVSLAQTEAMPALQTLVGLMRSEAEQELPGALAIVTALSHALFAMALRAYSETNRDLPNIMNLCCDPRLAPSVHAMMAEPGRAWTIAELGEHSAMSRATYARHFRERAGMTVWEFMTQMRMTIACNLLQNTRRSAADIGMEVGYQSEAAFDKAFRQSVGVTPGRYRSQLRAEAA